MCPLQSSSRCPRVPRFNQPGRSGQASHLACRPFNKAAAAAAAVAPSPLFMSAPGNARRWLIQGDEPVKGRNPVEHSSAWCVSSPTVRMALACAVGHGRHAHDGTHRTAHVCGVGKVHAGDRPRLHRFHQLGRAVRPLTSPAGQSGRIFAAAAAAPLPLPLENSPCLGRYATAAVSIGG